MLSTNNWSDRTGDLKGGPPSHPHTYASETVLRCRHTPRQAGTSRFIIISCRGIMANILIINADSNLKRLIKLALPGMEHFVQHSASWQTACTHPSSSKLDLVIARLVADDDQGPEDLIELRKAFPTARLIVTAALHDPALEGQKFQRVVRELQIEYCLLEPIETGAMLHTIQAALALPQRSGSGPSSGRAATGT